MALKGEQFKNTYMPGRPDWLSPEHHTNQGPEHLTKLHRVGGLTESHRDTGITTFDVEDKTGHLQVSNEGQEVVDHARALKRADREDNGITGISMNDYLSTAVDEVSGTNTNRQGMLFDPYTGTGLPRDPTVSKEQRLAAVTRQLDLRGKGAPQLHETYAVGDTPVSEFDRPIVRSPHGERSGASTMKAAEFYEGGPAARVSDRPKVVQGRGQRGGGVYQTRTNTASVNKYYAQKTTDYQTRSMNRPTKDATSTGTAWNPDWYTGGKGRKSKEIMPKGSKVEDDANEPYITANILKHSFHNPETGETLNPHTGPNEPVSLPWSEETPEEIASNRRYGNQLYVNRSGGLPGRRGVTGTSGKADPFKHLGRFHPGLDPDTEDVDSYVNSWDTANALKNLHEAGFQSELHKGSGVTKDRSYLPDSSTDNRNPHPEFKPMDPDREPRLGPEHVMLPAEGAEGFLIKRVQGGERLPPGEWRSGVDYSTSFHKRRIPSETETVERLRKQVTEWPDASTAFHEREHAIDPNIGLRTVNRGDTRQYHVDPVMEGVADAGSDRAIGYANVHEDALNPSLNPSRSFEIEDQKSIRGYGTKNKAWKTDQDRAVYAATRIHSAMADEPNIPDRVELVLEQHGPKGFGGLTDPYGGGTLKSTSIHSERNTDIANDTLLGKLYHENKHVRDGLRDLGFERVGRQAAERHVAQNVQKKELPDWKRDPEQETLFGPSWDPQE
jgi:hypothetical protein